MNEIPDVESNVKLPIAQERLEILRKGYGNVERVLKEGYEISGNSDMGEIKDARESTDKRPMIVRTNTGAIVREGREILTERLSACVMLFIRGPGFNYLVHLTPSSVLGYYYHRYDNSAELAKVAVKKIFDRLPVDVVCENLSVDIIANKPNETDDVYGRAKVASAWRRLEDNIKELGVQKVKTTELPLDEILVYFSPLTPGSLYAIGNPLEVKPDGNYLFQPGEIVEGVIDLTK